MRLRGLTAVIGAAACIAGGLVTGVPAYAAPVSGTVQVNEVESNDPNKRPDWTELHNFGDEPVDLSGYQIVDNDPKHTPWVIPQGTIIDAGGFLVFEEKTHFDFGLGKDDSVRLLDPSGALIDELSWTGHANGTYGIDPRTGEIVDMAPTPGEPNVASPAPGAVVLNEIDSAPADYVELYNTGAQAVDLGKYELRDNSDDHRWRFPAGTMLEPGAFFTVDSDSAGQIYSEAKWIDGKFGDAIGIGSGDSMRIIALDDGTVIDEFSWTEHASYNGSEADATLSRCPDGTGSWQIGTPTLGAPNTCVAEIPTPETPAPAPTPSDVVVLDTTEMFLEDSSGLDVHDGHLYAIDNGTGTFWKLAIASDGSVKFADGWEQGKRIRFQKDADDPSAKGPDTEGITVDGQGMVYAASERDNSNKGVNFNTILMVDPNAAGPDLVAPKEWDITDKLPAVDANVGIEAVEWVANDSIAGKLVDANTGAPYDPANYPNAVADGVFFTALEANGHVYAFVLDENGGSTLIADIDSGLGGAMALDFDTKNGQLWVAADNGHEGQRVTLTFNGTTAPEITKYPGIAGMETLNNEGFALGLDNCVDGTRNAYFFEDGVKSGALKYGAIPCAVTEPTPTPGPTDPAAVTPTITTDRPTYTPQAEVKFTVTGFGANETVRIELHSDPVQVATVTTDAAGAASGTFTLPADAAHGPHDVVATGEASNSRASTSITITSDADIADVNASASNTAEGLASSGAEGLTWMLVVAGVIVVLGAGLFLLSRGNRSNDDDLDDPTTGAASGSTSTTLE